MTVQFALLKDSLSEILQHGTRFADMFYQRLFSHYPDLQRLFTHTNMQAQHTRFLVALFQVLDQSAPPTMEEVTRDLVELGQRHRGYNVQPEHYPIVGDILLSTLADFLADKWTPEVEQAWTAAYATMTRAMLIPSAEGQTTNSSNQYLNTRLRRW